ncbi:MAG: hypothetical protein LBB74_09780 [Chitinispirillales bacterium]|jgi:hypothetical protein|nr:hypothetical protein [Chitinispirillales bacterium]
MIRLQSDILSLDLIDPRDAQDRTKLGSRYCAGGYIWQVYDADGTPLLSGPQYPAAPSVFDGQGMPDMFETPLGGEDGAIGDQVCVIGVGLVEKSSGIVPFHPRNNPRVTEFCVWYVDNGDDWAIMTAGQRFGERSITIRREIRLQGGRVTSICTVFNIGKETVDLRWFTHPFFPINDDLICGKVSPMVSMPDNAGYELGNDGEIGMKPGYLWEKGLFQVLYVPMTKLRFTVPHPVAGSIDLKTDYDVVRCAVWGNLRAFSFEPFMQCAVKPGEDRSWEFYADFGAGFGFRRGI